MTCPRTRHHQAIHAPAGRRDPCAGPPAADRRRLGRSRAIGDRGARPPTRLRIGPDTAANGVYLPPSVHKKTFGDEYFRQLNDRLKVVDEASPTATKDAKSELAKIARDIERGRFPVPR